MFIAYLASFASVLWIVTILSALLAFRCSLWNHFQVMGFQRIYLRVFQIMDEVRQFAAKTPADQSASVSTLDRLEQEMNDVTGEGKTIMNQTSVVFCVVNTATDVALVSFACGVLALCLAFFLRLWCPI